MADSLSESEEAAAAQPTMRRWAPLLGTVQDRLEQVPEFRRVGPDGTLTGVKRLVGTIRGTHLPEGVENREVPAERNALVGDLGPGDTEHQVFWVAQQHFPTRRVIALNAAAVEALGGTGVVHVRATRLQSVRMEDLRP
ncbi:MAG: hypothetical protein K1X94_22080 [Sandaracinaceae bacterium]|nr:hypothetical protein [Sandaracinaceae bacterium]